MEINPTYVAFSQAKSLLDIFWAIRLDDENDSVLYKQETVERVYSKEELIGNLDNRLDNFLLNFIKYSQKEREVIIEAASDWLGHFKKDPNEH